MFSHFTLGSNDLTRSEKFYSAVMPHLGQTLLEASHDQGMMLFGFPDWRHPFLSICQPFDGLPATWSNGFHIAFMAADKEAVERFHESALARGGYDEGAPGIRSIYASDYYAAFVRDPDGNKLQVVCYLDGRETGASGEVISHITIGHSGFDRAQTFYAKVLAPLGLVDIPEEGHATTSGFGLKGFETPIVYVQLPFDGRAASFGNGTHVAFSAPSAEAVDQFHAAALANGGRSEGAPGRRPHYADDYYAAYVSDHVGNKLQAVFRGPV